MFGLFGRSKNTVKNPKVLVASIGSNDTSLVSSDRRIYEGYFDDIETCQTESVAEFYKYIREKTFDILHLFASLDSDQTIEGETGPAFFERLSQANVKIFIFASDNEGDLLIPFCSQATNAGVARMNLVMTLDRKGELFGSFFKTLFGSMVSGRTMPEA